MCLDRRPYTSVRTGVRGTASAHTGADLLGGSLGQPGTPLFLPIICLHGLPALDLILEANA